MDATPKTTKTPAQHRTAYTVKVNTSDLYLGQLETIKAKAQTTKASRDAHLFAPYSK